MKTVAEMNIETDSILQSNVSMRTRIQQHIQAIAKHAEDHGDIMPCQYLADKFSGDDAKGLNIRAIGDWFNAFTKCKITYDAKAKRHVVTYRKAQETRFSGKGYKPWYEFKPSTISDTYSLVSKLQADLSEANKKLVKKTKYITDGNFDEANKIDTTPEQVAALRVFVSSLVKPATTVPPVVEGVEIIPQSNAA